MARSLISEAEHRRGLVLGLTLAEVLLLLLFLLLLALGAQLVKLRDQLDATPDQDKAARFRLEQQLSKIGPILLEAEKINPDDPPEALRRGLAFVQKLGTQTSPDRVRAVAPELAEVIDEASKLNSDGPPERLIKRGLTMIKRVGVETPPDQVQRIQPEIVAVLVEAKQIDPQNPAGVLQQGLNKLRSQSPSRTSPATTGALNGKHNWPPIIRLSEADGYHFASGSAEPSPQFEAALSGTVAERLLEIVNAYDVNVIEVVGHTDEQPLGGRPSNLDRRLFPFLQGEDAERLIPADNAGLGLARAVAVLRVLRENKRLMAKRDLRILPLSGAQLTASGDLLATGTNSAVTARRRIEIRLRRSDKEAVPEIADTPEKPEEIKKPIEPRNNYPRLVLPTLETRPSEGPRPVPKRPEKQCFDVNGWPSRCP
jgi:outer membrane protein OmpA-like peptidoglycan-associated protein